MLDNSHDTNGNQESLSLFTARVHVHLQRNETYSCISNDSIADVAETELSLHFK